MASWQDLHNRFSSWRWRRPFVLLLIAVVTVAVFLPVLQNGFVDYDDPDYVTVNMMVRNGLTIKGFLWSFTAFHAGNWHPLTWLSHMADVQFFDLNPAGHHAVNVVFHAANAVLVCFILESLTGCLGRSVLVALLFALHPLHVESVAWISERKDVLSTFFWLLTMLAYLRYVRTRSLQRYLLVAAFLALGLMAKQMLVTLPVVLLLMDFWPLRRVSGTAGEGTQPLRTLVWEKLPLLALSAAAAVATLFAQSSGKALHRDVAGSLPQNLANGLISYASYLGKMLWPVDLAFFYPLNPGSLSAAKVAAAALLLGAITAAVAWQWRRRPYLAFGWGWYLVTLLPVIGFIRVGSQAMADRYSYVPLIGIFVALVWWGAELPARWRNGGAVAAATATALLAVLALLTVTQIGYWRSSYDLYSHALSAVEDNWLAHNNMGILQAQQYRYDEAVRHFSESLRINPDQAEGYRNLGNAYQATGKAAQAIAAFRESVRLSPGDAEGHFQLGYAYLMAGDAEQAYQQYLQLQQLDEGHARPLLDSIRMAQRR